MKLEVTVSSNGSVLCHDVIEKNESSPENYPMVKKIQVRPDESVDDESVHDEWADARSGDEEPGERSVFSKNESRPKHHQMVEEMQIRHDESVNDKRIDVYEESEESPIHSMNESSLKRVQEKIQMPHKTGDDNKNTDIKVKEESAKGSFFSKFLCCCGKKKNQNKKLPKESPATESEKKHSDAPPLRLKTTPANQPNADPSKVLHPKVHQPEKPFQSDDISHPYVVIPLKSSQSDIRPVEDQPAENPPVEDQPAENPPVEDQQYENQPLDLPTSDYSTDELSLSPEVVDNKPTLVNVTPIDDTIPGEQKAVNKDQIITDIYFEAVVSLRSN